MEADTELSCDIPPDKTSESAVHGLKSDTAVETTVSETRENNNTSEVSLLASNFKDLTEHCKTCYEKIV